MSWLNWAQTNYYVYIEHKMAQIEDFSAITSDNVILGWSSRKWLPTISNGSRSIYWNFQTNWIEFDFRFIFFSNFWHKNKQYNSNIERHFEVRWKYHSFTHCHWHDKFRCNRKSRQNSRFQIWPSQEVITSTFTVNLSDHFQWIPTIYVNRLSRYRGNLVISMRKIQHCIEFMLLPHQIEQRKITTTTKFKTSCKKSKKAAKKATHN